VGAAIILCANFLILAARNHPDMKIRNIHWVCFAMLFSLPQWLFGQKIAYSEVFLQLIEQADLSIMEPFDAGYSTYQPPENDYLNCQHAIYSNKERLEIRYYVIPWDSTDNTSTTPHVATMQVLASVATNAKEAVIFATQLEQPMLMDRFNADWGMTYLLRPKPGFSEALDCKMMVLSKIGQGTVFVFLLFNDPNNPAIDLRDLPAMFR